MKQSFTLKAVALGLAAVATLGASAARPQVDADLSLTRKAPVAFEKKAKSLTAATVKNTNALAAISTTPLFSYQRTVDNLDLTKEVASRAIDPYGPWQDAGTMDFTFNMLFLGDGPTKTYTYEKRVNPQNEKNFQIRVTGWGAFTADEAGRDVPGSELVLTVTPVQTADGATIGVVNTDEQGVNMGWDLNIVDDNGQTVKTIPATYFDHYTWAKNVNKFDSSWSYESWKTRSVYDYSSGKFTIYPAISGPATSKENLMYGPDFGEVNEAGTAYTKLYIDYIQLSGKFYNYDVDFDSQASYFYRNAAETTGHFKGKYALNDNAIGFAQLFTGAPSTQDDLTAMVQQLVSNINNQSSELAVVRDPQGWFDLDVDQYVNGAYTVLFAYSQDGEQLTDVLYAVTYLDGEEFVEDGFAKYNDVFIRAFLSGFTISGQSVTPEMLGLAGNYTTTCRVEKSEEEAGVYRLRAPYAQYDFGESGIEYYQSFDYLYYTIADPAKAYVLPSYSGVVLELSDNDEDFYMMGGSSMEKALNFPGITPQNCEGVYSGNKLTFPGSNYEVTFTSNGKEYKETIGPLCMLAFGADFNPKDYNLVTNPQDFLIETDAVDAIENVEASADVNAPVEYYNLQGQKVVNPAAGQLVIKKQGSKVTKMIAQ